MVVMVVVMVVVASVLVWAWVWACACCGVVWCGGAIPPVSTTAAFTKEFSLCAWMCVWVWVCGGASLEVEARLWRWRRVAGGGRASIHLAGSGKCRRCVRARGFVTARGHTRVVCLRVSHAARRCRWTRDTNCQLPNHQRPAVATTKGPWAQCSR